MTTTCVSEVRQLIPKIQKIVSHTYDVLPSLALNKLFKHRRRETKYGQMRYQRRYLCAS